MRWIERHAAGVQVIAAAGSEPFDKLILAAHADQSLALLSQPTLAEREVLGAIPYSLSVQPRRAAHRHVGTAEEKARLGRLELRACALGRVSGNRRLLHYLLNLLQPLPFMQPVVHGSGRFAKPGAVGLKRFDIGHGTETRCLWHGHAAVVYRKQ